MKMSRCSVSLASRTVFPVSRVRRRCAVGGFIMNSRLAVIRHCVSRPWVTVRQSSTAMARISPLPFKPLSRSARRILHEILADAFPGCQFYCENEHSRFALKMRREGSAARCWRRRCPTVRCALCLAVALLSPRPPAFLAINEPENSLHRDMLPALARLIIEASRYSQIWLTSHSAELAELIAAGALVSAMRWRIAAGRRGLSVKPVIPDGGAGVKRGSASLRSAADGCRRVG